MRPSLGEQLKEKTPVVFLLVKKAEEEDLSCLRECKTVGEVKVMARAFLRKNPENIKSIFREIKFLLPENPGGRKFLFWLFAQVANGLEKIKPEYYNTFLNRLLTTKEPKIEIQEEWLK